MKRLLFFILFFSSSAASFAQADSIHVWNKWCARKDTMLLFTLGNNVIQVCSREFKPTEIKLKSLDASLRIGSPEIKGDTLSVLAMPYSNKAKKMRLAILNKKTSKQIKVVEFTCDSIPKPVAQIGKVTGKEISRSNLLAQTAMKAVFPNSLYSYPYSIRQYTFRVSTPKGSAKIPVVGVFITKDVLQQIKDAPVGTVVEFDEIKATCPECAVRTLEDLKIKIK